ncbi:phosphotransferase [Phytomonospora sp. NPDC050363]|uniref:phosphotransferase enzyme family protein n=1 Tax=Phytomonospora sp. NPDC050363 TaxID=3155642 RepID=UPI0033FA0A05
MTPDLTAVLAHHGLVALGEAVTLTGGADNDTVRVATGHGDVVVRRYLGADVPTVDAELDLVVFLAAQGFPTPAPFEPRLPGVAVFRLIAGAAPEEIDGAIAAQCGAVLARLHLLTAGWDDPRVATVDRVAILRRAITAPLTLTGAEEWRAAARDFLRQRADGLAALAELPSGPLHHDLHRHNLLVADGTVTALLDFGELQRGPWIVDLARAFHYLAVDRADFALPREAAAWMLAGYEQIRRLGAAERELLPLALDLVGLVDAADFLLGHAAGLGYGDVAACHSWRAYLACAGAFPL